MLFYRLLEQSIAVGPITYSSLIANPGATGPAAYASITPGRVAPVPAVHRPGGNPQEYGPPELNG